MNEPIPGCNTRHIYVKLPDGFMPEELLRKRIDVPESGLSERAKRLYREALLELGDALPLPEG